MARTRALDKAIGKDAAGILKPVISKLRKARRPKTAGATANAGGVRALDVGTYGDLRKVAKAGDNLEHDHIPSSAALRKAKEKELGRSLSRAEAREIHEGGTAIEVPKGVHAKSDTFRGRNTPGQIGKDASDLRAAAERDYATTRRNLLDEGYSAKKVDAAITKMRAMNQRKGI